MRLLRCIVGSVVLLALIVAAVYATATTDIEDRKATLAKELVYIQGSCRTGTIDPNTLELQCLGLIEDYNTPDEKGMIYALATFIQCERGFGRATERTLRVAKTIEYAQKALACPLDAVTSCRIYGYYCDALEVANRERPAEDTRKGHQQAVIVCLKGLEIALDNNAPSEMPSEPLWKTYNVFSPNEVAREAVAQMVERQKAEQSEYKLRRDLYIQRRALMDRCVMLYAQTPNDIAELRGIASEVLADHSEVAAELIQRVEMRTISQTPVPREK